MFTERTSVGLDVHARSVAAAAIDGVTGELIQTRLTPAHDQIRDWVLALPGPVAVTYEAGPTGFGLQRALVAAGIRCEVAAPSKLQRPAGDRVKTDAKDAVHLARLLRLDEICPVSVPSRDQEAARDLVRAREDCRGDLMRARHRLSKLLLRHGIVYYGGQAWTGKHDAWLRQQRFTDPVAAITFDSDYDTVATTLARRGRLDKEIERLAANSEFTPVVRRLSCLRGISTLTAFALAVEIGDWGRFNGNTIGSFVGLLWRITGPGPDHQNRKHPRPPTPGRSGLAPPAPLRCWRRDACPMGPGICSRASQRRPGQPAAPPTLGRIRGAQETTGRRKRRGRPRTRRLVLVPGGHRRLRNP